MDILHVIASIVIGLGAFFLLVGSIGLIRLPDFFSRTHATGKSDTLGVLLVIFGLIITQLAEGLFVNSAKLLLILAFVALTNPTATNALARAAYRFRLKPWFKGDKEIVADDEEETEQKEKK